MVSIGELVVNLRVKSEVKKIEVFEKRVKTLSSRLRDLRNAAMVLRFALRLFNSAAGRVNELNQRLEESKTAANNLNLDELGFVRFQDQLSKAGIESDKLVTVLNRINTLRKDIGRGGENKISAMNTFKDIGIEAFDTNDELKTTQQLLDEIITRSQELDPDSLSRLDDAFGATNFFPELKNRDPNARLGDALDNNSNISEETLKESGELAEALRNLKSANDSLIQTLIPLMTVLVDITTLLVQLLDQTSKGAREGLRASGSVIAEADYNAIGWENINNLPDDFFEKKAERERAEASKRHADRIVQGLTKDLLQPRDISFNNTNNITGSDPKATGSQVEEVMERTYGDFVQQAIDRILSNNEERE